MVPSLPEATTLPTLTAALDNEESTASLSFGMVAENVIAPLVAPAAKVVGAPVKVTPYVVGTVVDSEIAVNVVAPVFVMVNVPETLDPALVLSLPKATLVTVMSAETAVAKTARLSNINSDNSVKFFMLGTPIPSGMLLFMRSNKRYIKVSGVSLINCV